MPHPDVVRFGPFATDLRTGELLKHGARVRLQGQPIQVLGVLLERPGELVTREELRARLWGSETFVDFEHGLHAAVNKLRAALNDSADDPSYIETIPRRGYRFVGLIETSTEVDSAGGPLGVRPGSDPTPREQLRSAFASARILVAAALVTVAIVALIATRKTASRPSSTPNGRPMLAVLPFENLSGNADQEYFSDGLTEELITALGQLDSARLGVIARTSVMGYKRTVKKVRDIGRELGVEYVLGGSVRHDDERVRISVQLGRASDETDLWAHSYDKSIRDLLPVQAEIANAIAGELRLRLPGQDGTVGSLARHVKWEAYEAALRGRYFLERRTAEGIRKARESFNRAIDVEPTYAPAYVGLADAHILAATYADVPARESMAYAREAILKATALDDQDAAAHASLAVILTELDWDWAGAEREFKRARELNPNFASAHTRYAEYLSYLGRFEQAIEEARLARRLDPLSVVTSSLVGLILYRARRYDDALEDLRPAIELDPEHPTAYLPRGLALTMLGRNDEAIAALDKGLTASGRSSEMLAQLALAYGRAGRTDRASDLVKELVERSRTQHVSPFSFALAYTGLGDSGAAIEALETAYRDREWYLCVLKTEPIFDPLRGNPAFDALVRRLDYPAQ